MAAKRKKVEKYAGIYFREVPRLDGQGLERMYYITYRRGGRDSPVVEEPVGRASEGWTPAGYVTWSRFSRKELASLLQGILTGLRRSFPERRARATTPGERCRLRHKSMSWLS